MDFIELRYQHPATKTYLGSPSIIRLGSGDLLATHDYFGPGCPRNHEGEEHLTSVYRSSNDGLTWSNVTHVAGTYWSTLFLHRGSVYLFGTSQQYGSIVIRRSDDDGNTWTHPADRSSGLLFEGGFYHDPPNYHCAPVPVARAGGRLYRAFEDCDPCEWGVGFRALVVSADERADLLDACSWRMSNRLAFDPAWVPAEWGNVVRPGWLEGNVLATPDSGLWNILRFHADPLVDRAAIVTVHDDGARVSFDPDTGFVELPGGGHKFTIRRDPVHNIYITLSNANTNPLYPRQRNVLSLVASDNLTHWRVVTRLIVDDSDLSYEESVATVGFQYVDWQFDGEDIIYLVRTAYGGAHNYHDSNRITFHRLEGYRGLLDGVGRRA